jgi:hypothetical protein
MSFPVKVYWMPRMKIHGWRMNRAQFRIILQRMESLRHMAMEADKPRNARRMLAEYGRLFKRVKPFIEGVKQLDGEGPPQCTLPNI